MAAIAIEINMLYAVKMSVVEIEVNMVYAVWVCSGKSNKFIASQFL